MGTLIRFGMIVWIVIGCLSKGMTQNTIPAQQAHEEGTRLANEQQFEKAQQKFRESAEAYRLVAEQTGDTSMWAFAFRGRFNVWNMQSQLGNLEISIDSITFLIEEAKIFLGDTHPLIGKMYREIGLLQYHIGYYPQALESFQQSRHILLSDPEADIRLLILNNIDLIWALIDLDRNEEAISTAKKSLTKLKELDSPDLLKEAELHSQIAIAEDNLLRFEAAIQHNGQAMKLYEEAGLGISYDVVRTYINRGGAYSTSLQLDLATQDYQTAIRICEQIDDKSQLLYIYNNIGLVHKRKGDYYTAAEYFKKATDYAREYLGDDHPDYSTLINNLADVYRQVGDYDQALLYFQTAVDIGERYYGKDHSMLANTLNNLGNMYMRKGNYEKALSCFRRNINNEQLQKRDAPQMIAAYNNMGNVYRLQHQWEEAMNHFQKVLAMGKERQRENMSLVRNAYMYMAIVERERNNYPQSMALIDYALDLLEQKDMKRGGGVSSARLIKGKLLARMGQHESAIDLLQSAIDANVFSHIREQDIQKPLIISQVLSPANLLESLQYMAASYQSLNGIVNRQQADTLYQRYFSYVEEIRQRQQHKGSWIAMQDSVFPVYEAAIHNLLELAESSGEVQYRHRALAMADQSKAFSLKQGLQQISARQLGGIPADILDYEQQLLVEFANAEKQLYYNTAQRDSLLIIARRRQVFELKKKLDSLETVIDRSYPAYHQLRYTSLPLVLEDLQAYLSLQEAALVNYVYGEKELFIFLVQPDALDVWAEPLDGEIARNIDLLRRNVLDPEQVFMNPQANQKTFIELSNGLYRDLFAKVNARLNPSLQSLILIPDGPLNYLPFEILLTEKVSPEQVTFNKLPYLLKKFPVSYAYSAKLLIDAQERPLTNAKGMGGFAPSYDGLLIRREDTLRSSTKASLLRNGILPLPWAAREVEQITDIWSGDAFVGEQVTEALFRKQAPNYQVLHLSMHAFLEDDNSLYSHLLFTSDQDSSHDGLLEVSELYNMSLNADLAILSACNTGYGVLQRGEGVVSLSRAFAYAGVPSTVMSLWKVPDQATSFIMERFHRHLREGVSKPQALNQARQDYLDQHTSPEASHPFYWAGFVQNGLPDPIVMHSSSLSWKQVGIFLLLLLPFFFLIPYLRLRMKSGPGKPE